MCTASTTRKGFSRWMYPCSDRVAPEPVSTEEHRQTGRGRPTRATHERHHNPERSPAGTPHPEPVALMEYLIRTYTNPGDVVLDNCMGSSTTGVACINTGRSFIGIESDPAYFAIAQRRIAFAPHHCFVAPADEGSAEGCGEGCGEGWTEVTCSSTLTGASIVKCDTEVSG